MWNFKVLGSDPSLPARILTLKKKKKRTSPSVTYIFRKPMEAKEKKSRDDQLQH